MLSDETSFNAHCLAAVAWVIPKKKSESTIAEHLAFHLYFLTMVTKDWFPEKWEYLDDDQTGF